MKCCFCKKEIDGHGNNAQPTNEGLCCDFCNFNIVLPARFIEMKKEQRK